MTTTATAQPVDKSNRIESLDILRGFALLGILIMNIQYFSMPEAAYMNPMAYGDLTGINKWVWMFSHIFGDQKFMTIFSMLFGAGVILFSENVKKRNGRSAGLHYRRTFWLLIIGLIHAYLIWHGDILFSYALCALFVYLFRNVSPGKLLVIGMVLIAVTTVIYLFMGYSIPHWPQEAIEQIKVSWIPSAEEVQSEIAAFTGTFEQQFNKRSSIALFMQTAAFLMFVLWRAGGLMLVGMAFYKWGIFSAKKSRRFYTRGFLISWAIGLPIIVYGLIENFRHDWSLEYSMFIGSQFNYWGSLFVSFGLISLIMLLVQSDGSRWIKNRLAAVGQMALTNYIMQSLICVFVFYGLGLGLFGSVERIWQIAIVLGIWLLQIVWSRPWIDRFHFGPLEWMWRSLTYFRRQPFKK